MDNDATTTNTDDTVGQALAACYRIAIERARAVKQLRQSKKKEGNPTAESSITEEEKQEAIA